MTEKGFTVASFALAIGVSRQTVYNFLRGAQTRVSLLRKISQLLDLAIEECALYLK